MDQQAEEDMRIACDFQRVASLIGCVVDDPDEKKVWKRLFRTAWDRTVLFGPSWVRDPLFAL